jgi:hypothetical protein
MENSKLVVDKYHSPNFGDCYKTNIGKNCSCFIFGLNFIDNTRILFNDSKIIIGNFEDELDDDGNELKDALNLGRIQVAEYEHKQMTNIKLLPILKSY